jgi:hypothetical protein
MLGKLIHRSKKGDKKQHPIVRSAFLSVLGHRLSTYQINAPKIALAIKTLRQVLVGPNGTSSIKKSTSWRAAASAPVFTKEINQKFSRKKSSVTIAQ